MLDRDVAIGFDWSAIEHGQDSCERKAVVRLKGKSMSRLLSTTKISRCWEMVWYIMATRPGYGGASLSVGSAAHGCLPKTSASELRRLSDGLEPNRRTVWPCDTPVLSRRVYIDRDS